MIVSTLLALMWVAVFPLACDMTYSHITRSKWICALLGGGICSHLGCALLAHPSSRRRLDWRSPGRWLILAYFAWVCLSALLGSARDALNSSGERIVWIGAGRYEGLSTQLCYLAVFFSLSLCRPRRSPVILGAALSMALFCMICALQYAGVNPLGLFPAGRSIMTNYEFQGTIGNIDMVTGYLALICPLLLGAWLFSEGAVRWVGLGTGLAGVLLQIMTEVQAGLIAIGAGMLCVLALMLVRPDALRVSLPRMLRFRCCMLLAGVLMCFWLREQVMLPWLDGEGTRMTLRLKVSAVSLLAFLGADLCILLGLLLHGRDQGGLRPRAVAAVLLAVCVAAVALTALLPVPQELGGLWEAHEALRGRPQDSFGSWRMGIWRHTLHMAGDSLLFGTGPDGFETMMNAHLAAEQDALGDAFQPLGEHFDNPHNLLMMILACNGVPGLVLFLAGAALCVLGALRREPEEWPLAAAVLCWLAQGFFTFSIAIVSPIAWALMGLACGARADRSPLERS